MTAGVESGRQSAGPAGPPPSNAEEFLPKCAIGMVQSHPRFQEAVRVAIGGLIEIYSHNRLLNRVINDRGRAVGGMIALYLHYIPAPEGKGTGLTVGRFQALCVNLKICSPGRAWALLALMRFAGYLAPEPGGSDGRQRRLAPTEHLIEAHRQRWRCHFEALTLILPEGRELLNLLDRPEFMAAFLRHLGTSYLAGFRVLHYAPELARLVESNAGLLVTCSLFSLVPGGMAAPGGTTVSVSISALSARFGIARAHVRKLLSDAAEAGLVRRADGSEMIVIVLPRLVHTINNFFAALFTLLARCAQAVTAESRGVS